MHLQFLGAAGTVTGSKYLLSREQSHMLIDCGMFQGYKTLRLRNWSPLPTSPADLDAVLLTHAHIDHSGWLPLLVREGYRGRIFCTPATYELCRIMLPDSGRLQEEEADYANRHRFSRHKPALPLYTEADALAALERFETVPFDHEFAPAAGFKARFLLAGHILGASMVRVSSPDGSILFSGDLGRPHDVIMRPPVAVADADWLVVESTYGNRQHDPDDNFEKLAAIIRRTAARNGVVVIPSFAVGRAQELLYAISVLKQRGAIPADLPVYLNSPMAADVTQLYLHHRDEHRLDAQACAMLGSAAKIVNTVDDSKRLNERHGPMVIIAGSGMATGGRVVHHLKAFASDPVNTILLAGFQAGGTRGAALLEGAKSIRIHGEYVAVRAEVESLTNLSAHADAGEILDWLSHFERPPQETFVTHGEPQAADAMRQRIEARYGWKVTVPEHLQSVELRRVAATPKLDDGPHRVRLHRIGIDTYQEPVVFLRADSAVCRSEGFEAQSRVKLTLAARSLVATLYIVDDPLLADAQAGLSEAAWAALGAREGDEVEISHPEPIESFAFVRGKVYGQPFTDAAIEAVIRDVAAGHYSGLELAAFITACGGDSLVRDETVALTRAMLDVGQRLEWTQSPVLDKHCVGGLPGNRTTPIVVAIVAACGLTIPKTSSRAITSPAGTADTMEMLAPVELDVAAMRRVVEREGGCVVWGGAMSLSPADDILIRVERPLDFDSPGQLVASILSKKLAAGSTQLLVEMPVGPTAKVRSADNAHIIAALLEDVGRTLELSVRVLQTDGLQPVGNGVGPALEALDVLAVLDNAPQAPADLRERSLRLAGELLEMGGRAAAGQGLALARETLASGAARRKFTAICMAQGGLREPPVAAYRQVFVAPRAGTVAAIDNRRLARIAKLAGAPRAPAAGLQLHHHLGEQVARGEPLFTLHAESPGELVYAGSYANLHQDVIRLEESAA
nr:thymidine phosphorylase [Solimonas flava]